jgi:molybdopterin/thiamine biosynthesis adenylyltransferase
MNDHAETIYHRQLSLVPLDRLEKARVTVIGAGAVGSFTAFTLAKMGIGKILAYDPDTVEIHNVPNQLFSIQDCGVPKVEALRDMIFHFHGVEIDIIGRKYIDQALSGIVIVAVDSMDARIAIWERVRYNAAIELFIDSRMGAEVGRVLTVRPTDPDDVAAYEKTLHTSAEALQARCTEKAIIYTVLGIASAICGSVKRHLVHQPNPRDLVLDFVQSLLIAQR